MKKFSILMPTALSPVRSKYILEAIEAIREQTYPNWELIIKVYKVSAELEALQSLFLDKITIILGKDTGITDAMNQCMRFSTGDIMMWANDDDKLAPYALETIEKEIGNFEWGFGKILTDNGERGCACNYADLRRGNCISQPAVFWTRKAYEYLGEMDTRLDLVSDYEYWCRLMRAYKPRFIDKVLAYYRLHPDQITSKIVQEQLKQARELMITL